MVFYWVEIIVWVSNVPDNPLTISFNSWRFNMAQTLTTVNHDRDSAGLRYVYPVLSRRAGGVSIGVNFNTNNACNWRCIYCQVPELKKGAAPDVDLFVLEKELRSFLADVKSGDFFDKFHINSNSFAIKDIAISGNGEPTSAKNFSEALELIGSVANEQGIFPVSKFVLITNGSLIHQSNVQEGLRRLNSFGGEVWFKFDSATKTGRTLINNTVQSLESSLKNLILSSSLCLTKLQTCLFEYRSGFTDDEKIAFIDYLVKLKATAADVNEVLLYTLARPSLQPEAKDLKSLSCEALQAFADDVRCMGFTVSVSC